MSAGGRVVRITGAVLGGLQIAMGIALWFGLAGGLLAIHILNGLVLTGLLVAASILGRRAGARKPQMWFGIGWAVLLPVFGMAHPNLLSGAFHWVIQVLHLLVGIVALGLIWNLPLGSRMSLGRARRGATRA